MTSEGAVRVRSARRHHLYRAMAWLSEELTAAEQGGATPFSPRTVKDRVEGELFARRRSKGGAAIAPPTEPCPATGVPVSTGFAAGHCKLEVRT